MHIIRSQKRANCRPGLFQLQSVTCKRAQRVWRALPGPAREGRFVWRGKRLVVTHTTCRLLIHEADGTPVAYRYD
jgi:hypothetical protein